MTNRQKVIIVLWVVIFISLLLLSTFDEWIMDNWESIRWPSLIAILFMAALSQPKEPSSLKQGRQNINQIANSHPWIKLFMAIYCLIVAIVFFSAINRGINLSESMSTIELMISIIGIMLPVFIIQQIQLYKNAGKKL